MKAIVVQDDKVEKSKAIIRKLPLADWDIVQEWHISILNPFGTYTWEYIYGFKIKGITFNGKLI
jgi:hypothetical protein